jgi:hypothetical protein
MGSGFNGGDEMKLKSIPVLLLLPTLILVLVACGGGGEPLPDIEATVEAEVQKRIDAMPTQAQKLTDATPSVEKNDGVGTHYGLTSPWDTRAFKNKVELLPGQCPDPIGLLTQIPDRLEDGAFNEAAWSNIGSDIVIPLSDQAISNGSQVAAICVLDYLYFWAKNNAFVVDSECKADGAHWEHGYDRSNFTTGTLIIPYLQIRNASVLDETKRSVILSWFEQLHMCNKTRAKGMLLDAQENGFGPHNQTYSALLAVAMTSIALGKTHEFNWAIESYRESIATISPDGTAPNEVAHKMEWTQHYHTLIENFSIHLVLLGEINGVKGLFEDPGLIRLTNLVLDSYFGSTYLEELTGYEQTQNPLTTPWNLSWVEHLKRYNEDPRLTQLATQFQWQMDHYHTGGQPEYWWPEHMKSNT